LSDPLLASFFENTDVKRLKGHQRAFFTMALRGGDGDSGRSIRAAHQGRGITDAHFNRVAMHLTATLISLNVPDRLIDGVLGAIAPLRAEIVDGSPIERAA